MGLEFKFEATRIEVIDSVLSGTESRLIVKDVVNERLVNDGRKCVDLFPDDFSNQEIRCFKTLGQLKVCISYWLKLKHYFTMGINRNSIL